MGGDAEDGLAELGEGLETGVAPGGGADDVDTTLGKLRCERSGAGETEHVDLETGRGQPTGQQCHLPRRTGLLKRTDDL
jgi:hypothetical protein